MQTGTASPEQPACLHSVLSRSSPVGMHTYCNYLILMSHPKTCLEADANLMHIMVCHVSIFSRQPAPGNVQLYRNIRAVLFLCSSWLGEFCHTSKNQANTATEYSKAVGEIKAL